MVKRTIYTNIFYILNIYNRRHSHKRLRPHLLPPLQAFQKLVATQPSFQISTWERAYSIRAVWPAEEVAAPTYFCMFTIRILNSQSTFNYNCYQELDWLFKIRIVNMQKYLGAVIDVCGSGGDTALLWRVSNLSNSMVTGAWRPGAWRSLCLDFVCFPT